VLVRRIAYPLLAAVFVANGVDTILNLKQKVETAKPLLAKGQEALPIDRTVDAGTIVQVDAAAKIGAGLLLAFGRMPRLSAAVLAATLIPSTVLEHPFWASKYPDERKTQQAHAIKNAGLLGGLLLAVTDTHGKPSLAYRAKKNKKAAAKGAAKVSRRARRRAEKKLG
jgi:putative oxidoreductase